MIQHLFKLIWKRRKSNFLIMLEIFVAFIILFAVSSLGAYLYQGYVKPAGIKADNVWALYVNFNTHNDSLRKQNTELLRQKIKRFPEVKTFSFTHNNVPYGFSSSNGSVNYKDRKVLTQYMSVEETYPSVLGLELEEGTWFKNTDTMQKAKPTVITHSLKEVLFGTESAIGKRLGNEGQDAVVVGVIGGFKFNSDFQNKDYCTFQAIGQSADVVLLRVDPAVNADFEAQFAESIQNLGKDWSVEILHLDDMKKDANLLYYIPMIVVGIVCGFLIVNVMLGLFGVLFQNINRRRGEIGIRRAMGATGNNITNQFIGEMTVLATFAIVIGVFFAIQFPILNVFDVETPVYISGIIIAVIAVYGLVLVCSWIPSRQAAAIYPAMALHEE